MSHLQQVSSLIPRATVICIAGDRHAPNTIRNASQVNMFDWKISTKSGVLDTIPNFMLCSQEQRIAAQLLITRKLSHRDTRSRQGKKAAIGTRSSLNPAEYTLWQKRRKITYGRHPPTDKVRPVTDWDELGMARVKEIFASRQWSARDCLILSYHSIVFVGFILCPIPLERWEQSVVLYLLIRAARHIIRRLNLGIELHWSYALSIRKTVENLSTTRPRFHNDTSVARSLTVVLLPSVPFI